MPPTSNPIRFSRSPHDLLRLLVLLTLLGFLGVGVYRLLGPERTPVVDAGATYQAARAAAVFPVASPTRLPSGWRVLTSDYQPDGGTGVLRVSLRASDGGAVQLVEGGQPADDLLSGELGPGARRQSKVVIESRTWQRYTGEHGLVALVLAEQNRMIIVVGTASDKDLRDLVGVLD